MRNLFILMMLCSHSFLQAIGGADLIISSNKVILMNGKEEPQPLSIAIKNKKIAWIGSHEDAKNIQGKHIDFGNQAILPGFIDAHGHASYLAFATQVANIASPPVGKIKTIEDLQAELRKFIKDFNGDENLIFVTHYIVISELLNYSSSTGEIVISDKNYNLIQLNIFRFNLF